MRKVHLKLILQILSKYEINYKTLNTNIAILRLSDQITKADLTDIRSILELCKSLQQELLSEKSPTTIEDIFRLHTKPKLKLQQAMVNGTLSLFTQAAYKVAENYRNNIYIPKQQTFPLEMLEHLQNNLPTKFDLPKYINCSWATNEYNKKITLPDKITGLDIGTINATILSDLEYLITNLNTETLFPSEQTLLCATRHANKSLFEDIYTRYCETPEVTLQEANKFIQHACFYRNWPIAQLLLINAENIPKEVKFTAKDLNNSLQFSVIGTQLTIAQIQVINLLCKLGADPSDTNKVHYNSLEIAYAKSNLEVINFLQKLITSKTKVEITASSSLIDSIKNEFDFETHIKRAKLPFIALIQMRKDKERNAILEYFQANQNSQSLTLTKLQNFLHRLRYNTGFSAPPLMMAPASLIWAAVFMGISFLFGLSDASSFPFLSTFNMILSYMFLGIGVLYSLCIPIDIAMKLIKNKIDHLNNPYFENHFNLLERNQNLRIEYLSLPKVEVTSYLLNERNDNLTSIENDMALITTSHTFPTINPHTLKTSLIRSFNDFRSF